MRDEGREIAKRLARLMPSFDKFDPTLHLLEKEISTIDGINIHEVEEHFDLRELYNACRHYQHVLEQICRKLDEAWGKQK